MATVGLDGLPEDHETHGTHVLGVGRWTELVVIPLGLHGRHVTASGMRQACVTLGTSLHVFGQSGIVGHNSEVG